MWGSATRSRGRPGPAVSAGWVTNRPDGAVEAVFEGDAEAVESLVRFCREGPRGAEVDRAEVLEEQPEGLASFEIR